MKRGRIDPAVFKQQKRTRVKAAKNTLQASHVFPLVPAQLVHEGEVTSGVPRQQETKIAVVNQCCLATAKALVTADGRADASGDVCLLDMANARHAGGGWKQGCRAQEEELCRRTTLLRSLSLVQYPIPEFGNIFCPSVTVFKDGSDRDYKEMDKPFAVNVVAAAAYNRPKLDEEGKLCDRAATNTRRKISSMLNTCLARNQTRLVLSAFGCGAFGNPAPHVAQIFKDVLLSPPFLNRFHTVVFAILDDHNGTNLAPFQAVFP